MDAKQNRETLMGFFLMVDEAYRNGQVLLTRPGPGTTWESLGFAIDKTTVVAAMGRHPYQPIGTEDGTSYTPTPGSKLLWSQEFALATLTPIPSPFKVSRQEIVDDINPDQGLTDEEHAAFRVALTEISDQMSKLSDPAKKPAGLDDAGEATWQKTAEQSEQALRDTLAICLARYHLRKADAVLVHFAKQHPELSSPGKLDLIKVPISDLAFRVTELLRMKLDDDSVRRFDSQSEIVAVAPVQELLIDQVMRRLAAVLPAEGKGIDIDAAMQALDHARVVYPELADGLKSFEGTSDVIGAVEAALKALQAKKG